MKETLQRVINTLNNVEVKGEQNLDRLLGSIQVLKSLVKEAPDGRQESK